MNTTATTRKHPNPWRAKAVRLWPRAEWICGRGPYALLAHCSVLTVTLHQTMDSALNAKRTIDSTGCGHACPLGGRGHQILNLADKNGAPQ